MSKQFFGVSYKVIHHGVFQPQYISEYCHVITAQKSVGCPVVYPQKSLQQHFNFEDTLLRIEFGWARFLSFRT